MTLFYCFNKESVNEQLLLLLLLLFVVEAATDVSIIPAIVVTTS